MSSRLPVSVMRLPTLTRRRSRRGLAISRLAPRSGPRSGGTGIRPPFSFSGLERLRRMFSTTGTREANSRRGSEERGRGLTVTRVSLLLLRLLRAVTRAVIIRLSWCLIRSSIRRHRSVRGSDRKPTISIIRLWLDLWSILSADIDGGDFMTEQLTAQELQKLHKGLGEIDREI